MSYIKYILFFASLLGLGSLSLYKCGGRKTKEVIQITNAKLDSSKFYKDLYGSEHAQRLIMEGSQKVMFALNKDKFDSVCKRLNLKERQLKDMANVVAQSNGSFAAPITSDTITIHDSIPGLAVGWIGKRFTWSNRYMSEKGFIDSAKIIIQYSMTLPITITTYWKRKWFLGKKRYYIDGFSEDNHVNITGISGYKIN